jgi:cytochrome c peroxidase
MDTMEEKWKSCRLATAFIALALAACGGAADSEVIVVDANAPQATAAATAPIDSRVATEELSPRILRRFAPLVAEALPARALTDLGRMLYFDDRLSKTREVSCNNCHPLNHYGVTGDAVSKGIHGRTGARNAPSTYNAFGQFVQFWDGRAATVEQQAIMPIENAAEMGMTGPEVVARLQEVAGYRAAFAAAFPDEAQPISFARVGIALGAFERGLVTPARWDRYLRGDTSALDAREKAGAKLFANLGCIVCHTGPYVGGSMFEKAGARVPWPNRADLGRRQVTHNEADDMIFKVPSLRNVAQTAPYFHDGSAPTLDVAVRMMARHQLGLELEDEEAAELEAWLGSLTGDPPANYIAPPVLPQGA